MPIELSYLSASVALFLIYLLGEVVTGNIQYNPKELLGARDTMPPNNMAVGRAKRATQNMLESMIMFAPLILIAHATDRFNDMTELGAGLFLGARILYAPFYWFGVPVLRSLAWFAGVIGIVIVFLQVLPFTGA
ncbi:MAG: MAPEG family protein [Pseudomonadota bacterium]